MLTSSSSHDQESSGAGLAELTGRQIGRYLVGRRLGSGGVATVYQAYDQVQRQTVALKVLMPTADEKSYGRFRREALTAGALRHPHIVRILQVGSAPLGEIAYIAMELIEGESLADLLAQRRRLSPRDSCSLLAPIARALAFAHRAGVVHRDVKPSNILLRLAQPGAPYSIQTDALDHAVIPLLSDFGIARGLDAPELTNAGRTVGTPAYMAPEQCAGSRTVDGRADIYALGAVLYRCVAGRLPFTGSTTQILHAHVYEPLTIETATVSRLPPLLVEILRRSLAKEPEARFADADQMASALEQVAAELLTTTHADDEDEGVTATMTQSLAVSTSQRDDHPPGGATVLAAAPVGLLRAPAPPLNEQASAASRSFTPRRNVPIIVIGVTMIALLFVVGVWLGASVWRERLNGVAATPIAGGVTLLPPTATSTYTPPTPTPTLTLRPTTSQQPNVILVTPVLLTPMTPIPATGTTAVPVTQISPTEQPATFVTESAPSATPEPPTPGLPTPDLATATPTNAPTATATPPPTPSPAPSPSPTPTTVLEEIVIACTNVADSIFAQFIAGLPPDQQVGFLCPNAPAASGVGRLLSFQNGFMLQMGDRPDIYIYYVTENQWERSASLWRPGDPPPVGEGDAPEDGLYIPDAFFGDLWVVPRRQSALGYALAPEPTTFSAIEQSFPAGVLIADLDGNSIYQFLTANLRL